MHPWILMDIAMISLSCCDLACRCIARRKPFWVSTDSWNKTRLLRFTYPETNITPEKIVSQKERIVFQPSIFGCENVCFREGKTARYPKSAIKTWLKINVHSYQKITRDFNGFHKFVQKKTHGLLKEQKNISSQSIHKKKKQPPKIHGLIHPEASKSRNQGNTSTNHQGLGCHPWSNVAKLAGQKWI